LKFDEFKVGQLFKSKILINEGEFNQYLAFSKVKNILHTNPKIAEKEGIKGTLLPGRAILARAEGEMTQLGVFFKTLCYFMEWTETPNGTIGIRDF